MPRLYYGLLLLMLTACAGAGDRRLPLEPLDRLPAALSESSGLVATADGFVSHNDSGNAAELFMLNKDGRLQQRRPLALPNHDWEDIARHDDTLFLADTGNNGGRRQDLAILRMQQGEASYQRLAFRYIEQQDFQPPRHQHNFDAEALTWVNGELWLFTKRWLDQQSSVYRLAPNVPFQEVTEWQRLDPAMLVTGADYDAASQTLLLVGYSRAWFGRQAFVWLYPVRDNRLLTAEGTRFRLRKSGQFEAIALGEDNHIYLTREGRSSRLYRSRQPLSALLEPEAQPQ